MEEKEKKVKKSFGKRLFKFIRKAVIGTAIVSTPAICYTAHTEISLNKIDFDTKSVDSIADQYGHAPISIVCLSDSQGVNLNPCFWKPSFSEYVAEELRKSGADVQLINASSLKFNKASHIDKMLCENLSYEEIKTLNEFGSKEVFKDFNSPISLGFISPLFTDSVKEEDRSIHIADAIQNSKNPIVFYSCGAEDLMNELNCNPLSISQYHDDGRVRESYEYLVYKAEDSSTLDRVMEKISKNFNNIYALNPGSQIYALSMYVPKRTKEEAVINVINEYNARLQQLCEIYGAHYISTEEIATICAGNFNPNLNEVGHKALANLLIEEIANNLITDTIYPSEEITPINVTDGGLLGFYQQLESEVNSVSLESYPELSKVYLSYVQDVQQAEILEEKNIAEDAYQKVYRRK